MQSCLQLIIWNATKILFLRCCYSCEKKSILTSNFRGKYLTMTNISNVGVAFENIISKCTYLWC